MSDEKAPEKALSPAEKRRRAGAANLAKWKAEHPEGSNFRHGAFSQHFAKRFSDARTTEGREMRRVIDELVEDAGGMKNLTAGQKILLGSIRSKLGVLKRISTHVDALPDIIDKKSGELVGCLGKNFISFSEALRRDVEAFYASANKRPSRVPSLEQYLAARKREKDEKKRESVKSEQHGEEATSGNED